LELLLLTDLDGASYWQAACAAAWRRSRGYFVLSILLWLAAAWAGTIPWVQAIAGMAAGVVLWGFYFTLGFRAFARGAQANQLGLVLTLLLPMVTGLLAKTEWRLFAVVLPPGSVYFGSTEAPTLWWMLGPVTAGVLTLVIARRTLVHCEAELRCWYDRNHGINIVD
jgi:hypothetical protein